MTEKVDKDWGEVRKKASAEGVEQDEGDQAAEIEQLSVEELEEKLVAVEQEALTQREQAVRAMAEVDNVRRRAERDVTNAHRFAIEKFVDSLLPVMDSLEHALDLAEKAEDKGMKEGLELTIKVFLDVLKKHQVEQINPQNSVFDPQQHEAMSMQPSTDVPPNTVIAVFQKGYLLNERVIRPARVVVAKEEK